MLEIVTGTVENIFSPMLMFFLLGVTARLLRSDLEFPDAVAKGLSLYLMLSVGFRGGTELAHVGVGLQTAWALLMAIVLSLAIPFVAFALLQALARPGRVDAAAIAAHYGSISVVTFLTAAAYLTERGIAHGGELVAMAALMETPAIISGLLLARSGEGKGLRELVQPVLLRKILVSGSIVLLLGSFAIGALSGEKGAVMLKPFVEDPFRGLLCLFLLDLGLLAGARLASIRGMRPAFLAFGVLMPLTGAVMGLIAAWMLGYDPGSGALLAVLCGSASYIVVPTAMRMALPEANPAYSLTLSLGITFPFNMTIGIPLYWTLAQWLLGE